MSLKRKTSSLDPVQKQKKFRQTQYFALLDKCLQIPCDDKIILRKNLEQQEEKLVSLLQKQRKEGVKDLKDLQIYLRKYVQKYKSDHPKYPTFRFFKGSQSCLNRNSMPCSVSTSKVRFDLTQSHLNTKNNIYLQPKSTAVLNSTSGSNIRVFQFIRPNKQKSYEQMIRKRKTQKLKISDHQISVTIENQSRRSEIYKSPQNSKFEQYFKLSAPNQNNKIQPQENCSNSKIWNFQKNMQSLQMKSGQNEINVGKSLNYSDVLQQARQNNLQQFIKQSQMAIDKQLGKIQNQSKVLVTKLNKEDITSTKINLIDENKNISLSKISQELNNYQIFKHKGKIEPLKQASFYNQFQNMNKISSVSSKLHQQESKRFSSKEIIEIIEGQSFHHSRKIKGNSSTLEPHFIRSNLNSQIVINKENQQIEIQSFGLQSQKKYQNYLPSLGSISKNQIDFDSFSRRRKNERNVKQNRSSKMIFSHRMVEVISGRKSQHEDESFNNEKGSFVNPICSFRQIKKGASKLQFWARIQKTINE